MHEHVNACVICLISSCEVSIVHVNMIRHMYYNVRAHVTCITMYVHM